jgi:hypothetical protein
MKITIQSLKKLIKEEHSRLVQENPELWAKEEELNKDLDGDGIIGHPDVAEADINEQEQDPEMPVRSYTKLPEGALSSPLEFVKNLCALETVTSAMLVELANQAIDNPAGAVGFVVGFLEQASVALPDGVDQGAIDNLVQMLMKFEVELPFLGTVSVKQALQNPMMKPMIKSIVPAAVQAACGAINQLGEDTHIQEHITKDLLKKLVKEQLAK